MRGGKRAVRSLVAAAVLCGAAILLPGLAGAEFEIPEVDVERGGIEAEYRGASHQGLPAPDKDGAIDALRQSHELEIQYGLTSFWALRLTPNVEQPAGASLEFTTIGLETQFVLVPRHGGTFGLALMGGYAPVSWFVDLEEPDEFEFGPVIEVAQGGWLLTLNPRLVDQVGRHAETEGLGFEYAGQLEYRFADRWSVALLSFGEIDELAHTGSFDEQTHLLGPGIYFYSSEDDEGKSRNNPGLMPGEWSLGVGTLLGLTGASADTAIRVTFAVEY